MFRHDGWIQVVCVAGEQEYRTRSKFETLNEKGGIIALDWL